jgi:hypothetical protein
MARRPFLLQSLASIAAVRCPAGGMAGNERPHVLPQTRQTGAQFSDDVQHADRRTQRIGGQRHGDAGMVELAGNDGGLLAIAALPVTAMGEYSTASKAVASDDGLKPDRSAFGGLTSH